MKKLSIHSVRRAAVVGLIPAVLTAVAAPTVMAMGNDATSSPAISPTTTVPPVHPTSPPPTISLSTGRFWPGSFVTATGACTPLPGERTIRADVTALVRGGHVTQPASALSAGGSYEVIVQIPDWAPPEPAHLFTTCTYSSGRFNVSPYVEITIRGAGRL